MQISRQRAVLVLFTLVFTAAIAAPVHAQQSRDPRARGRGVAPGETPVVEATKEDLQEGRWVAVEGRRIGNMILAEEIEVRSEVGDEEQFQAVIQELDLETMTLVAAGRRISVSEETEIEDEEKLPLEFSAIRVGQVAEAEGNRDENGTILATELEIEDGKPEKKLEVQVEGMIESADPAKNSFVVAGIKVLVNRQTQMVFAD